MRLRPQPGGRPISIATGENKHAMHQMPRNQAVRTPPEVTGHAERAATAMLAAVMSGTEPFGQVCRNWLAKVPGA
jgi:hypothetical protein